MLGNPVWSLLKNNVVHSWRELKAVVEKRFGLTTDQLLDAFYAVHQGKGETEAEYVLRVEDKRLQLGSEETTCFRQFTPLLDEEERMHLDTVHELTATIRGTTESLIMWENLMARARFGSQCSKLVPGRNPFAITGFRPQLVEEAAPRVLAVQVGTPRKTATATSKDNR